MRILRRINIKTLIYLVDMLLIGHSLEQILVSQDAVIFLLQHLGFVKTGEIEFLGLTINSVTLKLFSNKTKILQVVSKCQNLLNSPQTSVLKLTKLIGLLTSTIPTVLPARLSCHFLQMQRISSLSENLSYIDKIILNKNSKIELE